jgi:transglutaminase-like putative cysteine protease
MRYRIEHETVLDYAAPVREHHVELRLAPRVDAWQRVLSHAITTEPTADHGCYHDFFGNRVDYFSVIQPHERLTTRMVTEVETLRHNPFEFNAVPPGEQRDWLRQELRSLPALHDFVLHRSVATPDGMKLAAALTCALPRYEQEQPLLDSLLALMAWVPTVLTYETGATSVHAGLLETLKGGAGVCQDFAHLFITVARHWGIPARYVMGYLDPGKADGKQAAPATHAWAEALVPGGGWIGFDATHNLLANDAYVPVAIGRDSFDAAPQRGSYKGDDPGQPPQVQITMMQQ